jgi:hypothetical protein
VARVRLPFVLLSVGIKVESFLELLAHGVPLLAMGVTYSEEIL